MWCDNPLLVALKAVGYNAVRLPRADLRPLQVMTQAGRNLSRLGELSTVFIAGEGRLLPKVSADVPAAAVTVRRTGDLRLGVGLSILGSVLQAMGGSQPGLDALYRQARTVELEFQDVLCDSAEVAELDQYLAAADVNPFSRHVAELLENDAVYATTATVKSRRLVVRARESSGRALDVNALAVQAAVGANIRVSRQDSAAQALAYEGTLPLVFGFQAVRLFFRQGRYTAFRVLPPESGLVGMGPPGSTEPRDPVDRFVTERAFIRLAEDG